MDNDNNSASNQDPLASFRNNPAVWPAFAQQPAIGTTFGVPTTQYQPLFPPVRGPVAFQSIPKQQSFDYTQQIQSQAQHAPLTLSGTTMPFQSGYTVGQAQKKRPWSPNLDITAEEDRRLEKLWAAHGVAGNDHLGLPSFSDFGVNSTQSGFSFGDSAQNYPFNFPIAGFNPLNLQSAGLSPQESATNEDMSVDLSWIEETNRRKSFSVNGTTGRDVSADSSATQKAHGTSSTGTGEGEDPDYDPDHEDESGEPDDTNDNGVKDESSPQASTAANATATAKAPPNNFVKKLHMMISDPKSADFIWWTELGTSFIVSSAGEFSRSILGQHFKHSNFSSFVRQLNMYGFHKINRTPRNQKQSAVAVDPNSQKWEFSHPKFLRGREDLLEDIKRKTIDSDLPPGALVNGHLGGGGSRRVELPTEVARQLREMNTEYERVVGELKRERERVDRLTMLVKLMWDRAGMGVFPNDMLETGNGEEANVTRTMKVVGNGLVPVTPPPLSATNNVNTSPQERTRGRHGQAQDADLHANKRTRVEESGGGTRRTRTTGQRDEGGNSANISRRPSQRTTGGTGYGLS